MIAVVMAASLSVFSTAMFAEPTVTQIEEVVRLVHDVCDPGVITALWSAAPRRRTAKTYVRRVPRMDAGVSARRTGTAIRRPLRSTCTFTESPT
jgi:hypothetical protein